MNNYLQEEDIKRALVSSVDGGIFEQLAEKITATTETASTRPHMIVYDLESYLRDKMTDRDGREGDLKLIEEIANYAYLLERLKRLPDAVSWYETAVQVLDDLETRTNSGASMRAKIYEGIAFCYKHLDEHLKAAHYRRKAERCVATAS